MLLNRIDIDPKVWIIREIPELELVLTNRLLSIYTHCEAFRWQLKAEIHPSSFLKLKLSHLPLAASVSPH
jgi:hypothetical protein